jgi:hypothetical protein
MVAVVLIVAACSISGKSSATQTTPQATMKKEPAPLRSDSYTPTPVRTPDPSASPVVRGTPEIPASGILLDPPDLELIAASGQQTANQGDSYWQILNGLASEAHSRGIQLQDPPLQINRGETVRFDWSKQNANSESTLLELKLAIYPKEGNVVTIDSGRGTFSGFKAQTDPVATTTLSTSKPTWVADVPPGDYFITVHARWSNPIRPEKERFADYANLVTVH